MRVWRHSKEMPGLVRNGASGHVQTSMVLLVRALLSSSPFDMSRLLLLLLYGADLSLLADALEASTSTLSLDARKRAEKDAHKKALKAEALELKAAQTIASSKVTIKRVERNKRKYVTAVSGLEAFGLGE